MDMEALLQARQAWFDAVEAEQDARNTYIMASDEFMSEVQVQLERQGMNQRQFSAMQELLASFLDDEEQDDDQDDGETSDEQAGHGEPGMDESDMEPAQESEHLEMPVSEPEPQVQSAADRLRGAGRRNPLQR